MRLSKKFGQDNAVSWNSTYNFDIYAFIMYIYDKFFVIDIYHIINFPLYFFFLNKKQIDSILIRALHPLSI